MRLYETTVAYAGMCWRWQRGWSPWCPSSSSRPGMWSSRRSSWLTRALPAVDQATQVCMGLWQQRSDEGIGCHLSFVTGGQGPVAQVCRLTHSELWQQSPDAGLDCHCL